MAGTEKETPLELSFGIYISTLIPLCNILERLVLIMDLEVTFCNGTFIYSGLSGIVVCKTHSTGFLTYDALSTHLRRYHQCLDWNSGRQYVSELRKIFDQKSSADQSLSFGSEEPSDMPKVLGGNLDNATHLRYRSFIENPQDTALPKIAGLCVVEGFQCSACNFCSPHASLMERHGQRSNACNGARLRKVLLETVSAPPRDKHFVVIRNADMILNEVSDAASPTDSNVAKSHSNVSNVSAPPSQESNGKATDAVRSLMENASQFRSLKEVIKKEVGAEQTLPIDGDASEKTTLLCRCLFDVSLAGMGVETIGDVPVEMVELF